MIKKIDIAGIQLDNYSVKESLMIIDRKLAENIFVTVEEVNSETLILIKDMPVVGEVINSLELSVIVDNAILKAVGKGSIQRKYEIEGKYFSYELFKKIERNHQTVFLLGETEDDLNIMKNYITEEFPDIKVLGMSAIEDCAGVNDSIINEINAIDTYVVVSLLPSPVQEQFLSDNRDKLAVNLWYGVKKSAFIHAKHSIWKKIKERIKIHRLEKHINDF